MAMATTTTSSNIIGDTSSGRPLDIIIFGATGFTGTATVHEAVKLLTDTGTGLRFGIAGRNARKLRDVLATVGERVGRDLSASVPIVLADVADEGSLQRMAEQTKLVINCCGPFRTFGEPVVSACIAAGTHHLDVSGEPQYIERMQLLHDEAARRAGSLVIVACGFDSIPADLGVVYTEQQFGGTVNAIESYLRAWQRGGIRLGSGAVANYGTWESIVHGIAHWNELAALRAAQRKADATAGDVAHAVALPAALLLRKRGVLHRAPVLNGRWALPFPGADRAIVLRSQRILHRWDGHKRPVQMRTYVAFDSWLHALAIALFAVLFAVMARFAWGREQLLQHPRFFSGGAFSHQGPTEETQARTRFSVTFRAEGWQDKRDGGESAGGAVDKRMVTRVTGTNPGYGATCVAVVLAAKVVLTEAEKVRGSGPGSKGGVVMPGAAFARTSLIEQLSQNGFTFEVLETGGINE